MEESCISFLENLEQLIADCKAGERHAQTRLYGHFAPRMFMVCQRYASSREEAEDILQEGFIRIFTHLHQYRHEGPFEGWMRRIIVNCALQRYQQRTRRIPVVRLEAETCETEDNIAPAQLGEKELLRLVRQLPAAYRMVFNLYVFEGLKHREIASLLGISEGTSKSNLSDARTLLQRAVKQIDQIQEQKLRC